jgi:hypothetical protein
MKHLQKFNEAKGRNREIDPAEKMNDLFFEFIEKLSEVGGIARSEQSHSNFVSSDKESVDDTINEYGKLLSEVNKKFETFKSATKLHYGE